MIMDDSQFDRVLEQHFHNMPDSCLDQLEQDVWRSLRNRQHKPKWPSYIAEFFDLLSVSNLRLVPVLAALVIGVYAGSMSQGIFGYSNASASEMLSLYVFSAEYPQLPSSLLQVKL
ncbi:MAG: hypothetical protein K2Q01_03420 [Rickettsiales bacterium]|nr:hypothetical protein [Rickettsiales bacterium]